MGSTATYPIPSLSPATRADLDEACHELLGHDFETLVSRCRTADAEAARSGGAKGWRPTGRGALPLRIALEAALAG